MESENNIWSEGAEMHAVNWMGMLRDARIWVYLADRALTDREAKGFVQDFDAFLANWEAHGKRLNASWRLCGNRLLFVAVDEANAPATGCSIDASVNHLRNATKKWREPVDWFDRQNNVYKDKERWHEASNADFWALRKAHHVTDDTMVVNVVHQQNGSCWEEVVIPFSESWHSEMW